MRECGPCSLCCKLPPIPELNKPVDTWCDHCAPGTGGCKIYADRPKVCSDFQCEWLREPLVENVWRPIHSRMIMYISKASETLNFINVAVDPGSPKRWRNKSYYERLKKMALHGMEPELKILVRVLEGNRQYLILPHKDVEIRNWNGFRVLKIGDKWDVYR